MRDRIRIAGYGRRKKARISGLLNHFFLYAVRRHDRAGFCFLRRSLALPAINDMR
ncbi:MAG: hypothetical protein QFF03_25495 [Pseudomonadota bacterium]|nr:hypothetical protein [Pseudomonadota bacterium]